MYGRQPASLVFAMESINWPLMPKSHNLMLPVLSSNMLDGFTSAEMHQNITMARFNSHKKRLTLHTRPLQCFDTVGWVAYKIQLQ